jgi:hypothetical protein
LVTAVSKEKFLFLDWQRVHAQSRPDTGISLRAGHSDCLGHRRESVALQAIILQMRNFVALHNETSIMMSVR